LLELAKNRARAFRRHWHDGRPTNREG
jgi:hypothetical protein